MLMLTKLNPMQIQNEAGTFLMNQVTEYAKMQQERGSKGEKPVIILDLPELKADLGLSAKDGSVLMKIVKVLKVQKESEGFVVDITSVQQRIAECIKYTSKLAATNAAKNQDSANSTGNGALPKQKKVIFSIDPKHSRTSKSNNEKPVNKEDKSNLPNAAIDVNKEDKAKGKVNIDKIKSELDWFTDKENQRCINLKSFNQMLNKLEKLDLEVEKKPAKGSAVKYRISKNLENGERKAFIMSYHPTHRSGQGQDAEHDPKRSKGLQEMLRGALQ